MPQTPFIPKSTKFLERGHFWAIPLEGGGFGAGCVVGECCDSGKPSTRLFIAGVAAWHGESPPTASVLAGRAILEYGFAHILAITQSGGEVLGTAQLQFGSTPTQSQSLSLSTWGFGVPAIIAAKHAASRS